MNKEPTTFLNIGNCLIGLVLWVCVLSLAVYGFGVVAKLAGN